MNIEKTHESKSKDSFPNFYPFSKNLEIALETSNSTFEFLDNKFPEENKGLPKKLNPLKISESFSLDHLKNLIYDFAYFSMESIYFIALISSNLITFLDLPKKPNSSFMLRETIIIELIEKKNKVIDNALEGVFKVPSLEKEFLNCCEFGYKIRSNNSKLLFLESETDLVLACGSRSGLIYIVTINESFEINYLYGHINEIYSLKFATPNQTFNFQNILISGSKDGSMILWNIHNEAKIAIFSPKQNPNSDVLSVSWAPHCDYIVSVGLESMVKVWTVSPKLKRKIEKSHSLNNQNVGSFKKMEINLESYKNNEAHKNFEFQIDQIEFYGTELLFF